MRSLREESQKIDLSDEDHAKLKQLQQLMNKNESLKKKESEFKAKCKAERESLQARNKALKDKLQGPADEPDEDGNDSKLEEKMIKLKKELAAKSSKVSDLENQLDQVPSSYELQQYQRRFLELDNQVSAEFSATQQFVTLYNTLIDQRAFTEKAITLLESVYDTVPDYKLSSTTTKSQFVDKLSRLLHTVDQAKSGYHNKLKEQESKKVEACEELNRLLEEQRSYAMLVRDLREEMRKNEQLSAKLMKT